MAIFGKLIERTLSLGGQLQQIDQGISPLKRQRRTLRRLLRKAQGTAFGQYYHFREILREPDLIRAYQDRIPVFDYDTMHERWWRLSLGQVENVSWKGRVRHFALSSGTSGAPSKQIPITDDMRRAMRRAGLKMFFALTRFDIDPDLYTKPMLMLGGSSSLKDQGGYFVGDLSGINASKPPFWLRPYYKPGSALSRIIDWNERIDGIVKAAPKWDIGFLVGIPSWLQLMMERIIDHYHLNTIHDIWPNLEVLVHGGIHFEPYRKGFERLLAHPLVYMDSYLASEGFLAYQDRPGTHGMKMLLQNGIFFEFVPFPEAYFDEGGRMRDNPPALSIGEVEEGVDYALLLSTCSGAWRYRLGDTVRFTDLERSEIVITGRTKHFLSICGEHLSVDNMNEGVREVEKQLNTSIPEFTVCAIRLGSHFGHKWYLATDPPRDNEQVRTVLDEKLRSVNDDYATERDHVLQDIKIEQVPPAYFYGWQESQGKLGGQNKFPRVMKPEMFDQWEAWLRSEKEARK